MPGAGIQPSGYNIISHTAVSANDSSSGSRLQFLLKQILGVNSDNSSNRVFVAHVGDMDCVPGSRHFGSELADWNLPPLYPYCTSNIKQCKKDLENIYQYIWHQKKLQHTSWVLSSYCKCHRKDTELGKYWMSYNFCKKRSKPSIWSIFKNKVFLTLKLASAHTLKCFKLK